MRRFSLTQRLKRFCANESGSMTYMGIMLLATSALVAGFAVDIMRFENRRTQMQSALDICVLNAASLRQTLNETTMFNDCVKKSGMTGVITKLTITEGYSSKSVSASASETVDSMFLDSVGIDTLTVAATSSAMERVGNVEVALVLDVSGSMAGTRLTNLKTAAKDFVKTLLTDDSDGRVLITLVPYNGQVNLGDYVAAKYNVTNKPYNATNIPDVRTVRCVDLPSTAYTGTAISRTTAMPATTYVDTFSTTNQVTSFVSLSDSNYTLPVVTNMWCPPTTSATAGNVVRLPSFTEPGQQSTVDSASKRVSSLQASIESLTAVGATSINAGMRWGLAFLDPSMNEIYKEFIANGQMPSSTSTRPLPFNDADVLKVIVLMSDGENFAEERMKTGYQSGSPDQTSANKGPLSPIYRASDGNYSIQLTSCYGSTTNKFWVPHTGTCQAAAYKYSTVTPVQQTWGQIWEKMRMSYVAWQFYGRPASSSNSTTRTTAYNNAMAMFRGQTTTTAMDTQLQSVCSTARTNNVVVYTIAFEASTNGQTQLKNCASTTSRYYTASTTTISQVFASIAGNISKLKLTQ